MDRSITGKLTGERYAVDYTPDFPAVWPEGMSLQSRWNETATYADVLVERMRACRCLNHGVEVR